MFSATITLFNLHGDTWHLTELRGCCLIVDEAAKRVQAGIDNADRASLYIPQESLNSAGVTAIGSKEYDALASVERLVTFHEGIDFFIEGHMNVDAVRDSDDRDGYYDYLNRTRDGVYLITSAAKYAVIPHWEISGK